MALAQQTRAFLVNRRLSVARTPIYAFNTRPLTLSIDRAACAVCSAATGVPSYKGDLLNRTYYPTGVDAANVTKKWYIIDAKGKTLGRLAALAASVIRGKHEPTYTPSMDMGGYVVVINADKVVVTGSKFTDKEYFTHVNGRPGSYRTESFKDLQQRIPERIIEHAVQGMLPKGRLGHTIRLHLKVFRGPTHDHTAQQPIDITPHISAKPTGEVGAQLRAELAQIKAERKRQQRRQKREAAQAAASGMPAQ